MNFKYFVPLILSIIVHTAQARQKPEIIFSGPTYNPTISFGVNVSNALSNHKRSDQRYQSHPNSLSQTDRVDQTIENLTLGELNNLPPEYQDHPRVLEHRNNLKKPTEFTCSLRDFTITYIKPDEKTEPASIIDAHHKIKQRQQIEYQQSIPVIIQKPDATFEAYRKTYQKLDVEKLQGIEAYRKAMLERRKDALTTWEKICDEYQEKTYKLIDAAQELLNKHSMKAVDYLTCYGNPFQHLLHKEFIDIVQDAAHYNQNVLSRDREAITTTLMRFVETGQLYNRTGQLGNAFSCADFCWSLLDCAKAAAQYGGKLTISALKGIAKGTTNCLFKAIQLPRTFREMSKEVQYSALLAGHHLIQIREESKLAFTKKIEQIMQDQHDLALGMITKWDIIQRDFDSLKHNVGQTVEQVYADIYFVWQSLESEKILLGTEKVFEVGTEIYLTGKATNGINALFKNSCDSLSEIIQSGGGTGRFHDLPLNDSTLQAYIAYESIFAHEAAQTMRDASICVANALDKASVLSPHLLIAAQGADGGSGPSNPVSGAGNIPNPSMPTPQYNPMDEDIPEIHQLFHQTRKGFGPISDKYIKMDIEHILEGEVITKDKGSRTVRKLNGCHHDLLGYLEENNIIALEDKILGKLGTYKARPFGHKLYKCFFPKHWLHREVIANIYEAYDDFLQSGAIPILRPDNKWRIQGKSKIGLDIEMYIDQGGVIRTAYPVL